MGEHPPQRRPSAGRSRSFQAQQESSVPVQASWHDNRRPTVDAHRPAATFLLRPSAPPQDAVGSRCCLGWRRQAPPTPRRPPASALRETALKNATPSGGVRWQAPAETMGAGEGRERGGGVGGSVLRSSAFVLLDNKPPPLFEPPVVFKLAAKPAYPPPPPPTPGQPTKPNVLLILGQLRWGGKRVASASSLEARAPRFQPPGTAWKASAKEPIAAGILQKKR